MRRSAITVLFILIAAAVVWALFRSNNITEPAAPAPSAPGIKSIVVPSSAKPAATNPAKPSTQAGPVATTPANAPALQVPGAPPPIPTSATPAPAIPGLHVLPVTDTQPEPAIGQLGKNPKTNPYNLAARLTPWGAGVIDVKLSRYSDEVAKYIPYLVQSPIDVGPHASLYPLAADAVTVNGAAIDLSRERWRVTDHGADSATFALTLADKNDKPVLRIVRTWSIAPGRYNLNLQQHFENLGPRPLNMTFTQYGPGDVPVIPGYVGDRRNVVFGYATPFHTDPNTRYITTDGFDIPRAKVLDKTDPTLWPPTGALNGRRLVWVSTANRYFAVAINAPVTTKYPSVASAAASPAPTLEPLFPTILHDRSAQLGKNLLLQLQSVPFHLDPAGQKLATASLPLSVYAGPKDATILRGDPVYANLHLDQMVVFNLGGFCAICTFAWMSDLLLAVLHGIYFLVHDWAVAIMVLVAVVRLILHPLTKSSQIQTMKMSRQMAALQPELDRLKAKYKDNSTKLNAEMMNLYREKGVNPAAMGLGCLPMLLQTPIWFALYAVLYYAIELRHSAAFWGVFQKISGGHWMFLADLSDQDNFFRFGHSVNLGLFHISAINVLPILMAVVYWYQQKYMAAAPTKEMTDQQKQQQMMMRFSTLMIPIFLYAAPAGLNFYMAASSAVGIWESLRVRKHLEDLEARGELFKPRTGKRGVVGGFMDRLMAAAQERQTAEQPQQQVRRRRK